MPYTSLLKISVNHSKGHPLRKLLLLLGIAIGVAVVVAVDLANESIGRSFQLSTRSITGRSTHQVIHSDNRLDQNFYTRLRTELGIRRSAPVITGYIRIDRLEGRTIRMLGIDPFADAGFRNYLGQASGTPNLETLTSLLTASNRVLISKKLAAEINIRTGDSLGINTAFGEQKVIVAGLMESDNSFTEQALSGIMLTDIATAQEILKMGDHISHVDLMLDVESTDLMNRIKETLPPGAQLVSSNARSNAVRQMSRSFELNLTALSLLALLVGMFLIYNTVTFSIVQRRIQLGTLRALGVTRSEVFVMILVETLFWGIIGSTIGILLGIVLGTGTVRLVSQTVSDLYFTLTVNQFHISIGKLIKAFLMGIGASLLSGALPALEAANIEPVQTLRRSSLERRLAVQMPVLGIVGSLFIIAGVVLLSVPTRSLRVSFGGLLLIVFGNALLVPLLIRVVMKFISAIVSLFKGVTCQMASRNIIRSMSRTSVSIASLMIAISVIVGVGTMIGSFRITVVQWLSNTIRADLYIGSANRLGRELDGDLQVELKKFEGVAKVIAIRSRQVKSGPYTGATLISLDEDTAERKWIWYEGNKAGLKEKFDQGWVFISEPMSWKYQIKGGPGTTIALDTDLGRKEFRLAGIFRDFTSDQGAVMIAGPHYKRYWGDRYVFGMSVFLEKGVDPERIGRDIERRFQDRYQLMIRSNRGLRNAAIEVFDRTFTITVALQILAGLVAFIGVLNTVMSLILERSREIGVLRANGMTVSQLGRMLMMESGLIGLLAGLFSIPLGTIMAWILVHIINKRSFGWTLDFVLQPDSYLQAILIALVSAVLAGIYPMISISRKQVAALLRTE